MINSLSLVLVIVAAVTLALGWFQDGLALVHVSIATCLVALALIGVDRLLRRRSPAAAPVGYAAAPAGAAARTPRPAPSEGEHEDVVDEDRAVRASTSGRGVARPGPARPATELEQVRGLGPAKRGALLDRFGSVEAIAAATPDDLSRTPGIGAGLARAIKDQLG